MSAKVKLRIGLEFQPAAAEMQLELENLHLNIVILLDK
jgi:hypothetical protein